MSFGSEKTSKWFFTYKKYSEESLIDKCHDKRLRIKNEYELVCRWVIWNSWSKQSRNMFLYCSDNNKLCDYYTCHRKIHATNSNQTMLQVAASYTKYIISYISYTYKMPHHLLSFNEIFTSFPCVWWMVNGESMLLYVYVLYCMYVLSIFMPLSTYGSMI